MEPTSNPRGFEIGFENASNFGVDFKLNLAPTWAPGGGQRTKAFVSFSHLGAILDPKALQDPKTIDFLSILDRFLIDMFISIFGIGIGMFATAAILHRVVKTMIHHRTSALPPKWKGHGGRGAEGKWIPIL